MSQFRTGPRRSKRKSRNISHGTAKAPMTKARFRRTMSDVLPRKPFRYELTRTEQTVATARTKIIICRSVGLRPAARVVGMAHDSQEEADDGGRLPRTASIDWPLAGISALGRLPFLAEFSGCPNLL